MTRGGGYTVPRLRTRRLGIQSDTRELERRVAYLIFTHADRAAFARKHLIRARRAHTHIYGYIYGCVTRDVDTSGVSKRWERARTASMHSFSRTGRAIDVPSAIVLVGTFHVAGGLLPSSMPAAERIAVAIGLHSNGCAQKSRGVVLIWPARRSSPNPRSHPITFDPAPVGMITLSGAR